MILQDGSIVSLEWTSVGWGCMEPEVYTTLDTGPVEDVTIGLENPSRPPNVTPVKGWEKDQENNEDY